MVTLPSHYVHVVAETAKTRSAPVFEPVRRQLTQPQSALVAPHLVSPAAESEEPERGNDRRGENDEQHVLIDEGA